MVEFRLLGQVELWVDGRAVDLGPAQRRTVLACMLVDAGRVVPVETLIGRVWGERPPAEPRSGLYAQLARIRRLLAGLARVDRTVGGYVLRVDPGLVDLHRFRDLVARAREPGCADGRRLELLREALGLWRGQPLAGLPGEWAERQREAWRQQHLDAVVAWARGELRAGDTAALVGPLTDLVGEYPTAEPLVAALMDALSATGRAAEALDCFARARRRLAEELGTDPGAELQDAHRTALRAGAAPGADGPRAPAPVPAQLPADVVAFTGRDPELAALDCLLGDSASEPAPAAAVISAIGGTAGVGKTALAVHWAHRVRAAFPDGQLYVNLRGFDRTRPLDPAEALRGFLDALHVPPARVPADLAAQAGLYRSLLAGRRMLVLLDNARDAEQVRPLLPGAPGCLALVTSRHRLTGLVVADGAHPLVLDLLTTAGARGLLVRRLGPDRVAAEPEAVDEIVARCARLPLALTIVAARAAAEPRRPLTALAAEIRGTGSGLDALDTDDPATDVRTVFSCSYRALGPAAARLFRLLGLHPGPDLTATAAASLAGTPVDRVRPPLAELVRAQLLAEHRPGRFALHDLLRAYAAELALATETEADQEAVVRRVLDHYLCAGRAARGLFAPHEDGSGPDPTPPGVTPEGPADHEAALAWFAAEHEVLLSTVARAVDGGWDRHATRLASTIASMLDWLGRWHESAITRQVALEAARRLGDPLEEARGHHRLGHACLKLGRHDDARHHLGRAIELFDRLDQSVLKGQTHLTLALALEQVGDQAEALRQAQHSLDLFRTAGDRTWQARALGAVGWYHSMLDDHEKAIVYGREALDVLVETGDTYGVATTWDSLGHAHHRLGHHERAVDCFRRAVDLCRELGARSHEAETLVNLGEAHLASGAPDAARAAGLAALDVLADLDHPGVAGLRARIQERLGVG